MPTADISPLAIEADTAVYRLTAIKKAAYRFGDRCSAQITMVDDRHARIVLTPKAASGDLVELKAEFCNELLDQELREAVADETEGVRRLLFAQAFSGISLTDRDGEGADYNNDPLGIRRCHHS